MMDLCRHCKNNRKLNGIHFCNHCIKLDRKCWVCEEKINMLKFESHLKHHYFHQDIQLKCEQCQITKLISSFRLGRVKCKSCLYKNKHDDSVRLHQFRSVSQKI